MSDITAGGDAIVVDATGRELLIGKNVRREDRMDDQILTMLVELRQDVKHFTGSIEKMDTRIFRLEQEVKQVASGRWSLHDTLFVVGIATFVSVVVDFLGRLVG
jgi:dihydrodipicolinate synthase/N-acetylneuraminate lyase